MAGASIETTLELWASSLRDVKARIRPLFTQERVAASAGLFLDGVLGDERRKTGWMRAEEQAEEPAHELQEERQAQKYEDMEVELQLVEREQEHEQSVGMER
jgi:hypothetical protein